MPHFRACCNIPGNGSPIRWANHSPETTVLQAFLHHDSGGMAHASVAFAPSGSAGQPAAWQPRWYD
jgi:hypothetical protein